MERTIISFDYAIKNILRDKANFDILSGFLTEILRKPVEVLEIIDSVDDPDVDELQISRLELKASIDNGEIAIFEIQYIDQIDYLRKAIFKACKAMMDKVSKGVYYGIKKICSINIAYFNMFDEYKRKDYIFKANLTNFVGVYFEESLSFSSNLNPPAPVSDDLEYFIIIPTQFDEKIRGRFDEWVYTLKNSRVRIDFTAAGIQAASDKLDLLKMTDEERAIYKSFTKADLSWKSQLYTAELKGKERALKKGKDKELTEGVKEAFAKGQKEKAYEIVTEMILDGVSVEKITKYTGLTFTEIMSL